MKALSRSKISLMTLSKFRGLFLKDKPQPNVKSHDKKQGRREDDYGKLRTLKLRCKSVLHKIFKANPLKKIGRLFQAVTE